MPDTLVSAYEEYLARGLHLGLLPEGAGGLGLGAGARAAATELMAANCHAFQMLTGLVRGGVEILLAARPEGHEDWLRYLAEGRMLATMALSEPDAGSDLFAIRTRAEPGPAGWRLTGNKVFVSGGGQNLTNDILHFVLARTGERDGRAQLGLFAVHDRQDGAIPLKVRRLEEKLGLHGSPTCDIVLENCPATLVGAPDGGLALMFMLMDAARIDVALQAVGHAARASDIARAHARSRLQGRGPDRAPVTINRHGDVARMLDEIEGAALTGRAMCQLALGPEGHGLGGLLTPMLKAWCTDQGYAAVDSAIQVLGGYGYLSDTPLEQHLRDCRVTRIYEGTNGIMAMTLATRALRQDGGAQARTFAERSGAALRAGRLAEAGTLVLTNWQQASADVGRAGNPGPVAVDFLELTGLVWSLVALNRLDGGLSECAEPERIDRQVNRAVRLAPAQARLLGERIRSGLCA